jgi:hypothetical protein
MIAKFIAGINRDIVAESFATRYWGGVKMIALLLTFFGSFLAVLFTLVYFLGPLGFLLTLLAIFPAFAAWVGGR